MNTSTRVQSFGNYCDGLRFGRTLIVNAGTRQSPRWVMIEQSKQ
jgi:hypothetical protein